MYRNMFDKHIDLIRSENRYREFISVDKSMSEMPILARYRESDVVVWCSNDYLCMSKNAMVKKAAIETINKYGVGSGGTRNISGNNSLIEELEHTISILHDKEKSIVFTSGYVANQTTLSTIAKIIPNMVFFSDQCNHASIIEGMKNSKNKVVFKHNDVSDLKQKISLYDKNTPKIIVVESVYSMNGSICNLKQIVEIAKENNSLIYLDEVHGVGMYGVRGGGIAQDLGLENDVDIIQGTFGKAFGCIGGYISTSAVIADAIRSSGSGFIFSTSLPPMVTASCIASVSHLMNSSKERDEMKKNVNALKNNIRATKRIDFIENKSHIIPVMIKDAEKAKYVSKTLLEKYNLYVQHINYPTVPRGTERLRITTTNLHTNEMIENLVEKLLLVIDNEAMIH